MTIYDLLDAAILPVIPAPSTSKEEVEELLVGFGGPEKVRMDTRAVASLKKGLISNLKAANNDVTQAGLCLALRLGRVFKITTSLYMVQIAVDVLREEGIQT